MGENFWWGKSALINLNNCNDYISKPEKIREFVDELCIRIDMKKHGPMYIERFGEGNMEGYSFMQFIETSSIVGHFDEKKGDSNRAFIDIFSCKEFDEYAALKFCEDFFSSKRSKLEVFIRE